MMETSAAVDRTIELGKLLRLASHAVANFGTAPMITGIDHILLNVEDVRRAAADYAAVLGRDAILGLPEPTGGAARLQLDNVAISLRKPAIRAEGTAASPRLVLAVTDIRQAAHRLNRRGLPGTFRQDTGILDFDDSATHGVPISLASASAAIAPHVGADIAGLDHVVVRTPDPERAVALYGGRLGLDLRLDRTNPEFGSRMLFFVCGGSVVEITHDTKKGTGSGADKVWGVAWRANNIDQAHSRMTAHGVQVSEVRAGRRPGTRVFTVKSHTAGIPTLVIGGEGLHRA